MCRNGLVTGERHLSIDRIENLNQTSKGQSFQGQSFQGQVFRSKEINVKGIQTTYLLQVQKWHIKLYSFEFSVNYGHLFDMMFGKQTTYYRFRILPEMYYYFLIL